MAQAKTRASCSCCRETKDFQKILELESIGLTIYRYTLPAKDINTSQTGQIDCVTRMIEDIFIVHNTKSGDVTPSQCLSKLKNKEINCPRCRKIVEHAQKLLQYIPTIEKDEIRGFCDLCICRQKTCDECEDVLKKFIKRNQKEISSFNKKRIKLCLNKMNQILEVEQADGKKRRRAQSELYIDRLKSPNHDHVLNVKAAYKPGYLHKAELHVNLAPVDQYHDQRELNERAISEIPSTTRLYYTQLKEKRMKTFEHIPPARPHSGEESLFKSESLYPNLEPIDIDQGFDRLQRHATSKTCFCKKEHVSEEYKDDILTDADKVKPELSKLRRFFSEESLLSVTTVSSKTELWKRNFTFYFPKKTKAKLTKKYQSSSELIMTTRERLEEAKDQRRNIQRLAKLEAEKEKARELEEDKEMFEAKKRAENAAMEEENKSMTLKSVDKREKEQEEGKDENVGKQGMKGSDGMKGLRGKEERGEKKKIEKREKTGEKDGDMKGSDGMKGLRGKEERGEKKEIEKREKTGEKDGGMKGLRGKGERGEKEEIGKREKTGEKDGRGGKESEGKGREEGKREKGEILGKAGKGERAETGERVLKEDKAERGEKARKSVKEERVGTGERVEIIGKGEKDQKEGKTGKKSPKTQNEMEKLTKAEIQKEKSEDLKVKSERGRKDEQTTPSNEQREKEKYAELIQKAKAERLKTQTAQQDKSNELKDKKVEEKKVKAKKIRNKTGKKSGKAITQLKQKDNDDDERNFLQKKKFLDEVLCKATTHTVKLEEIIGKKICKHIPSLVAPKEPGIVPLFFKSSFIDNGMLKSQEDLKNIPALEPPTKETPTKKNSQLKIDKAVPTKGIMRYALSDRSFIDKGWTMLPTEKVVKKMNVYRMRPSQPEFDWFKHNKSKGLMTYDTGEKLAEFTDDGHVRWFYKNGRLALDYYDAEEPNAQQRIVVYSSGEPDSRGRSQPFAILATFDYLGNCIVFDHSGKVRMKYNQSEGVILDRSLGPVTHWKWHTLNDPPVLQQIMLDTTAPQKDPDVMKLSSGNDKQPRIADEEMLAIEFDNFIKEKSKKLNQNFKPFKIKMKAIKINEYFSLKVLDQATVYLLYRDGTTHIKLNIGMQLDHKEIVDTDTSELCEVSSNVERVPARSESLSWLQKNLIEVRRHDRVRSNRERRLQHPGPVPKSSADKLTAAASKPLQIPLRTAPSVSSEPTNCYCSRKPPKDNLYYDTSVF